MFSLHSGLRFWFCPEPTDMRKSFDGLSGLVRMHLALNPGNGDVFIFIGKRRDKIKLLHWEDGGFTLYYKRLESGTFELPVTADGRCHLSWWQLCLLIEGVSARGIRYRKRYKSTIESG